MPGGGVNRWGTGETFATGRGGGGKVSRGVAGGAGGWGAGGGGTVLDWVVDSDLEAKDKAEDRLYSVVGAAPAHTNLAHIRQSRPDSGLVFR